MKHKNYMVLILVLMLTILTKSTTVGAETSEENEGEKLILIDPGHGGYDGGADGNGVKEKNINLSISLLLKEELIKQGFDVMMTREKDEALKLDTVKFKTHKAEDLAARCKIKSESNCDLFISIHMNTYPESQYSGGQVWYSRNPESRKLADLIQRNFRKYIDDKNKRVAKPALDAFKMLRSVDTMPGVLVECGFISNPEEAGKLNNKDYQKSIAESITRAIMEYFENNKLPKG
ncbi:MAG: N-acetylmuramoyl-L-alanine amidase CwlD [Clostridiaceae bacterium]|nr:N-acetylmuramoyl-L-alanine amidase CwlD [Clostridiaceae bacterium]